LLFPARDLLPPDLLASGRQSTWLVCPMLRRGPSSPGYVVFERGVREGFVYDGLLDQIGSAYQRIGLLDQVVQAVRLRELAERERLAREMQIATGIQTGILPRNVQVDGLEISAAMHPATEVGGDYYDVIPVADGCWLGIGDVAGHGLPTGLVMLMLQSVVGGLVRHSPAASPRDVLVVANQLLFDNVRRRMGQDEHVTLTLIRYDREGRLVFAGAHEYILICRVRTGRVERLPTPGTWVAAIRDIREATEESSCELEEGDLLLLYTDGVTEAMNHRGEMFGLERLELGLASHCRKPVDEIRDALIAEVRQWMARQDDDLTVLVARQGRQFVRISARPRPTTGGA
jgi:serine phosphatase RsbU (regulator of sigma subunit)